MYCPECKSEYKEDILFCEDCSASLVLSLEDPLPLEEVEWVSLDNIRGDIYAEMVKRSIRQQRYSVLYQNRIHGLSFRDKRSRNPRNQMYYFRPL